MEIRKKWFAEDAPLNAKSASATLTFSDDPVVTDTFTIDNVVFEVVADAEDVADEGNIPVVISAEDEAVEVLADAINAVLDYLTAVADTENGIVVINHKDVGTIGNSVTVATDCANASWGEDVDKLSGGQYGTPCPIPYTIVKDDDYYYVNIAPNTIYDANWRRFTLVDY